jgi:hypothetical protein
MLQIYQLNNHIQNSLKFHISQIIIINFPLSLNINIAIFVAYLAAFNKNSES